MSLKKYIFKIISIIIYLILLLYLLSRHTISANNEKCTIKNFPPEEITNYINTINKITSRLREIESSNSYQLEKKWYSIWAEIIRVWNSLINHDDYISEISFYLIYPINNNINRDVDIMRKEINKLERNLYNITRKWNFFKKISKEEISSICNWIEKCYLKERIWDSIMELLRNTRKIRNLIQKSSMNQNFYEYINFVEWDFAIKLKDIYSKSAIYCDLENWFWYKIIEKIKNISINDNNFKRWIREWEESISLLLWKDKNKNQTYTDIEKTILKRELNKQSLSSSQTDAILGNLKDYNSWWAWFFNWNNYISNSFEYIKNSIKENIDEFSYSIKENYKYNKNSLNISNIEKIRISQRDTEIIRKKIETKYKQNLIWSANSDLNINRIMVQLINMHTNIWLSINILDKTKSISQKVCKEQWSNLWWNCE